MENSIQALGYRNVVGGNYSSLILRLRWEGQVELTHAVPQPRPLLRINSFLIMLNYVMFRI